MRDWQTYVREHLSLPELKPEREARIVRELAAQLEDFYRDALARGLNEADADAFACRQIRDWRQFSAAVRRADRVHAEPYRAYAERTEAAVRNQGGRWNVFADLMQDFRYALRQLRKSPAFTMVAVLTLALGIGANTAIFSVVHTVLLRPIPFEDPHRLIGVRMAVENSPNTFRGSSYPDFVDWQQQTKSWESLAALFTMNFTLTGSDEPEQVTGEHVTAEYFTILGVQPLHGRVTRREDDALPPGDPVVVLSHALWQRRYGGDPGIVTRAIQIDGRAFTVIGIMPPGFEGIAGGAELWTPLAQVSSRFSRYLRIRGARWLSVFGRLLDDATLEQARAELVTLAAALREQHPRSNNRYTVNLTPVSELLVTGLANSLWVLLAAVGGVLLIATANVANLLLARATGREREVALRVALGAGRARVVRQMLTESLVLSLAGGLFGVLLARGLVQLAPAALVENLANYMVIQLDGPVLAFSVALSMFTGIVFGVAPALQMARVSPQAALRESGRSATPGSQRQYFRSALVTVELGLAVVLLVGTGLLLQSFRHMVAVDPGFRPEGVMTAQFQLPDRTYGDSQTVVFARQAIERLRAIPGVQHAALGFDVPLSGAASGTYLFFEGRVEDPDHAPQVWRHDVSSEYLPTLGIRLLRGRNLTEHDTAESEPVALVSQQAAETFWPGEDPLGKRFRYMRRDIPAPWITVVGVTGNVSFRSLTGRLNNEPDIYVPLAQAPATVRNFFVAVQAAGSASALTRPIQDAIQALDPSLPVHTFRSMSERLERAVRVERLVTTLLGLFSATALGLAVIGIYGVISYSVGQRTQEIGVRMALGAARGDILRMIIGQGLKLTLAGTVLGTLGAVACTRFLASLLFNVQPTDAATFAAVIALLTVVAAVGAYIPARRATRVDPLVALRYE